MEDSPIRFLFDGGRHVEISEKSMSTYTLETLPKRLHGRKLNIHVVPFHQSAVEDMLMEQKIKKDEDEGPILVSYDPHEYDVLTFLPTKLNGLLNLFHTFQFDASIQRYSKSSEGLGTH